jgi:hypothetical protein
MITPACRENADEPRSHWRKSGYGPGTLVHHWEISNNIPWPLLVNPCCDYDRGHLAVIRTLCNNPCNKTLVS